MTRQVYIITRVMINFPKLCNISINISCSLPYYSPLSIVNNTRPLHFVDFLLFSLHLKPGLKFWKKTKNSWYFGCIFGGKFKELLRRRCNSDVPTCSPGRCALIMLSLWLIFWNLPKCTSDEMWCDRRDSGGGFECRASFSSLLEFVKV